MVLISGGGGGYSNSLLESQDKQCLWKETLVSSSMAASDFNQGGQFRQDAALLSPLNYEPNKVNGQRYPGRKTGGLLSALLRSS